MIFYYIQALNEIQTKTLSSMNIAKKIVLSIIILFFAFSCKTTNNLAPVVRDGSSFEKAIIVSNVPEEYEYVRRDCDDCKFIGQSLVFEKGKPYDILKFQKSDGTSTSYYFDVSKFYGKF